MAFDAFFLSAVVAEMREKTADARVEKIHQPSRDTVIIHIGIFTPQGLIKLDGSTLCNEKDHKPLDVAPGTGWSVTLKHPQKIDLSTAVMLRLDENMQL